MSQEPHHQLLGTTLLDRYVVKEVVGSGGMGVVYRGWDQFLSRPVAVKMLHAFGNSVNTERFQRECQTLARLTCEQVPEIYSWGVLNDVPFYVMELIAGDTLQKCIDEKLVTDEEDWRTIFIDVCTALSFMHEQGVVHRDLKPSNVMVLREPSGLRVKIMDFGIVHLTSPDQSLTKTGEILGSLNYMSPEHFNARQLNAGSDIFSFGCIMFACLSGKVPFEAETPLARMMRVQQEDPGALPDGVSPYLMAAIAKCVQVEPGDRFQSANDLKSVLQTKMEVSEHRQRRKSLRGQPQIVRKVAIPIAVAAALAVPVGLVIFHQNGSDDAGGSDSDISDSGMQSLNVRLDNLVRSQELRSSAALADELEHQSDKWWQKQPEGIENTLMRAAKLTGQDPVTSERYTNLAVTALEKRFQSPDPDKETRRYKNLIVIRIYQSKRDMDTAHITDESFVRTAKALQLAERLNLQHEKKLLLASLGGLARARGDSAKADEYLSQADKIRSLQPSVAEMQEDIMIAVVLAEVKLEVKAPIEDAAKALEGVLGEYNLLLDREHASFGPTATYLSIVTGVSLGMPKQWCRKFEALAGRASRQFKDQPELQLQLEAQRANLQVRYDPDLGRSTLLNIVHLAKDRYPEAFEIASVSLYNQNLLNNEKMLPISIKAVEMLKKAKTESPRNMMNMAFIPVCILLKENQYEQARPYIEDVLNYATAAGASAGKDWQPPFIMLELTKYCCEHGDYALAQKCLAGFDNWRIADDNQFLQQEKAKLNLKTEPYRRQIAKALQK